MSNQKEVVISVWTCKSEELLQKVKDLFTELNRSCDLIPSSVYDDGKPISVVFVGQFSAGKSTILKALTNLEEIEVGPGTKTIRTHTYDWNGIKVVDTPGIRTVLHPDHDDITYEAR